LSKLLGHPFDDATKSSKEQRLRGASAVKQENAIHVSFTRFQLSSCVPLLFFQFSYPEARWGCVPDFYSKFLFSLFLFL